MYRRAPTASSSQGTPAPTGAICLGGFPRISNFLHGCWRAGAREGGSGEREPSGKAPPESHLRHTLSAVSGPAVPAPPTATALYFPWETFVELQIEVAGKETGAAREWPVRVRAVLTAT